jgi:sulfofructose kinase
MTEIAYDIFGLGQCSLDYIGKIHEYPSADTKCEFTDMVIHGGGPIASALSALSRWGLKCYFCGVTGDDTFGQMIEASLRREGINTEGTIVRKCTDSQFAFIVCEPGKGRRTIFWRRPTGPPPGTEEIDYHVLKESKLFHTDGLFIDAAVSAAQFAKKNGIPVMVDAGTLRQGMLDLAPLSDYFITSETFASALVGDNDPLAACREISHRGPRVVGVTLGDRGYVAMYDGKVITQPAYPVEAVDTTGCGDVFHAGFIYGLIQQWGVEKSFDFAAWSAAMVSLKMGGRDGIPSLSQIKERGY